MLLAMRSSSAGAEPLVNPTLFLGRYSHTALDFRWEAWDFLEAGTLATYAGSLCLTLFEVVFMETAGYIIVGAICERIIFWAFLVAELFMGAILYPVFGCWVSGEAGRQHA